MTREKAYVPPYAVTPAVTARVSEISEILGGLAARSAFAVKPQLRWENRIKTIHASLAIENNTLTLEQVAAVIDGKRVLGPPREILEVKNALAAYDAMERWSSDSLDDLLAAHALLMKGLTEEAGVFRKGVVGVVAGDRIVHLAPPAGMVPKHMRDLFAWLGGTDEHPLVAGCVFHYELEFIHPFADGNGRMGRLWQTVILRRWKSIFAGLPVETTILQRQSDYYQALAASDKEGAATRFIEFMLEALRDALREIADADQVTDQATDQVKALLLAMDDTDMGAVDLMARVGLSHKPTFRNNYLTPALGGGWIVRTMPESPRSPKQRYRLTGKGRRARGGGN